MKQSCRKLIGNDIVDLNAAKIESNWRRKGYAAKIFDAYEQNLIAHAVYPDQMVWLFWSMKEAAYKINSKSTGERTYAPSTLHCQLHQLSNTHAEGMLMIDENCYHTSSILNEEMIHTICACQPQLLPQINSSISRIADKPDFDFHATAPQCISHHGAFLALVYLNSDSLQSTG